MSQRQSTPATRAQNSSRRQFIQSTGTVVAASALADVAIPHVHAAQDSIVRLAIIGCGPRGSGAVVNALSSPNGPCKLVAMADLVPKKLENAQKSISGQFPDKVEVPEDRRFIGFDAYKHAIDCLRPGDIALLTTRAAYRPVHFDYAVSKGVNAFLEKSFGADPGSVNRVLRTGELAQKKNLKIAMGLQCRHSPARQAMIRKMRDGEMGEISLIRAYRMQSGGQMPPRKNPKDELLFQITQPVALLWSSGGTWMENMIHQVDECCWIKDSWPVSCHGMGGRTAQSIDASQNLDNYCMEYTFADGAKALVNGRFQPKCYNEFATFVHGTKCAGQFSGDVHAATVHLYKDQRINDANITWKADKEKASPWQTEWDDFLAAVRSDQPYNEVKRSAMSNLAAIMGRAAVHMGRIVTWDEMLASTFQFVPNIDSINEKSEPPIKLDAEGRYPAPIPGKWTEV